MTLLAQAEVGNSSASGLGLLILLVAATVLAIGMAVFPLVDALSRPAWQWRAAHRAKGVWVAALFFFPIVGGLMYLVGVRPGLARISDTES